MLFPVLKSVFSVKMQRSFAVVRKYQKQIIEFLFWENMKLMMIKKEDFFSHFTGYRRGSMQKNILYEYCIAIEIKKWDLLTKYFSIFITGKIQYLQGTDH